MSRTGVWLVGARGSVATSAVCGAAALAAGLVGFRERLGRDRVVVVNVASTEPPYRPGPSSASLAALRAALADGTAGLPLTELGTERMLVDSAADRGRSDPLETAWTGQAVLDAGFAESDVFAGDSVLRGARPEA